MKKQLHILLVIGISLIMHSCTRENEEPSFDNSIAKQPSKTLNTRVADGNQLNKQNKNIHEQIILAKDKSKIKIPGYAFIDGRDLQATPPLTINKINVWDSYDRIHVICKLEHGTKVKVINAKYDAEEGRYYLNIKSEYCEGWISEPFVSIKKMKPVGDIF